MKINPAFLMYCLVSVPGMLRLSDFNLLKSAKKLYIHIIFTFNADTAAHTCLQVCRRDAEVDGGCRGVKHL